MWILRPEAKLVIHHPNLLQNKCSQDNNFCTRITNSQHIPLFPMPTLLHSLVRYVEYIGYYFQIIRVQKDYKNNQIFFLTKLSCIKKNTIIAVSNTNVLVVMKTPGQLLVISLQTTLEHGSSINLCTTTLHS